MKDSSIDEQTRVPIGWLYGIAAVILSGVIFGGGWAISLATWRTSTDIRIESLEKSTALQRQQLDALNEMNNRLANNEGELTDINTRGAKEMRAREKERD